MTLQPTWRRFWRRRRMSKVGRRVLCMLLWTWGGAVYFLMEVAWKTATGEPERISWTMLIVAMLLTVAVERCGYQLPWEVPLFLQALACSVLVTAVEFVSGLIINVWLGLGVWDYSHLPGNIMGQICPQFFLVWFALCMLFIPIFDWMWYAVAGGQRPHYRMGW